MAAQAREYVRLPGRGVRTNYVISASRCRLWLGRDHLLSVDSQAYSEDYKRFYFRDIQALQIRRSNRRGAINLTLAALAFLPSLAALAAALSPTGSRVTAVVWGIVSAVLLFFLLINTLMGPTCVCTVKTAVQTEELPSLRRLRVANKVIRRIRPLILEAQGGVASGQSEGATPLPNPLPAPASRGEGEAGASPASFSP